MDPTAVNQHFTNEKGKGWNIKIYNFWFNQDIIVNNIYQQNSNTVVQDFIQININIKDKQKVRMDRSIRMIKPICQKQNQSKLVNKRTDILTSLHNIKLPLHEYQYQSLKNNQLQLPSLHTEMCSPYHISSYRQYKPSAYKLYRDKDMTISEDYCSKYGDQVQYALRKEFVKGRFLSGHKIDATLRARMLDWMIQVMSSYNFQNKTYFAGVQIMDRYFSECSQTLVPTQLHIIGVESMQMATKMQQVYPLKLKTTYQKIVHKKISISELMEMQSKILHALSFNLVSSSIYDLAMTKIVRQLTLNSTYSEVNVKQIEDVCGCIAKFIYFNYELVCQYSKQVLASALVGQVSRVCKIGLGEKLGLEELECRDKIAECINGFRQKYKGLNNISKYTSRKIMEIVDPSII